MLEACTRYSVFSDTVRVQRIALSDANGFNRRRIRILGTRQTNVQPSTSSFVHIPVKKHRTKRRLDYIQAIPRKRTEKIIRPTTANSRRLGTSASRGIETLARSCEKMDNRVGLDRVWTEPSSRCEGTLIGSPVISVGWRNNLFPYPNSSIGTIARKRSCRVPRLCIMQICLQWPETLRRDCPVRAFISDNENRGATELSRGAANAGKRLENRPFDSPRRNRCHPLRLQQTPASETEGGSSFRGTGEKDCYVNAGIIIL